MKKVLALILALVMALSLVACSQPAAPADGEGDDAAAEVNVAVFYYDFSDVYISTVRKSLDGLLDAAGIKYTNYDAAGNQATQMDAVNTAIAGGANLLVVNIVETASPDAAQNIVEAAKTAGLPVVFFNREVANEVVDSYEACAFIGTDAPEAGHMQGKMIGEFLVNNYDAVDLNGDGTISYVMFKGQEGNAEAEARTQFGVEDADAVLTAAGKPALKFYNEANTSKYLVDQDGKWSSTAANNYMVTILAEYSEANGNMVELVIANNDGMAEGAVSALADAGYNTGAEGSKTIPVFGVDATDTAKLLIDEGKMTGTIKQDNDAMAATIMTLVENVKAGSELMAGTESYNVDDDCAKIRVPYGTYTK